MQKNSIILENLSTEQLEYLIGNVLDTKLKAFQEYQNTKTENNDLIANSSDIDHPIPI